MLRQAPGCIRLEQVVLQDKIFCEVPIIRDLTRIMVTHDLQSTSAIGGVCYFTADPADLRLRHKAVHLAAVNICYSGRGAMRTALVLIQRVVVWIDAFSGRRV